MLLLRRLVRSIETNGLRGAVAHSFRRLESSLRTHGLSGTLERAFRKPPAAPRRKTQAINHPFDTLHQVDTGGYISGAEMPSVSLSSLYATAYLGIAPSTFMQALSILDFDLGRFSFVDLGCGKGRALMLAAEFPFQQLLGVEIVPELCQIARENIAKNPVWRDRITVLNADAAEVQLPDGPLLIFLFDPFLSAVLRRVLANLERQLRANPREVYLLYANNPGFQHVMQRFPFLREVWDTRYDLSPEDLAADPLPSASRRYTLYFADVEQMRLHGIAS
ncbi:MAG TPA: class I SAM-dependent methyltransferase [Galbitalea sp.]|jgi:SAM-dependent methyltransferase|nr:class I SAM-dependent methyltransferase [Galbitalea sp.]